MDVTFVMEATLINNIKCLGSYDFNWKRNQNVQKHKVPSFVKSWPRSNSPQLKTLKIYLKKLPNCINSPFNRVSSGGGTHSPGVINQENPKSQSFWIAPILYGVGWGGGESQCWSTGTNECLRGADRQEHQSDKIKFFFVSYCYKILSRVWIDACSILTPVSVRGRGELVTAWVLHQFPRTPSTLYDFFVSSFGILNFARL